MPEIKNKPDCSEPEYGELLAEYLPRLLRLAERNMSPRIMAKYDPHDIAQSIFGSVIRLQREGKLALAIDQSDDFWKLLQAIALCKIRKRVRYLKAHKRDVYREQAISPDAPPLEELAIDDLSPTDEDSTWFENVLDQLHSQLDENQRIVLAGKKVGERAIQIAKKLNDGRGMSTKSVGRIWGDIKEMAVAIADQVL